MAEIDLDDPAAVADRLVELEERLASADDPEQGFIDLQAKNRALVASQRHWQDKFSDANRSLNAARREIKALRLENQRLAKRIEGMENDGA